MEHFIITVDIKKVIKGEQRGAVIKSTPEREVEDITHIVAIAQDLDSAIVKVNHFLEIEKEVIE